MTPKMVVIHNPAAKGTKAVRFTKQLHSLSPDLEVLATRTADDACILTKNAIKNGARIIIAAGGDGTINQVVNGIADSDVTLGILPIGTMNVFAGELGIPSNIPKAWKIIQNGHIRKIDLPMANAFYFVQLAGVGLDAQIVLETDADFRKNFGPLSYIISATHIASRRPPVLDVETADGRQFQGSFLLIGNGRYYGGPFPIFKSAEFEDGKLDFLLFRKLGYLDIIRYLQNILVGNHVNLRDVDYFQASSVKVTSENHVPVEIDGEVVGHTPFHFKLAPNKLSVFVASG